MHLYDDIGDASSSLRGSTSSYIFFYVSFFQSTSLSAALTTVTCRLQLCSIVKTLSFIHCKDYFLFSLSHYFVFIIPLFCFHHPIILVFIIPLFSFHYPIILFSLSHYFSFFSVADITFPNLTVDCTDCPSVTQTVAWLRNLGSNNVNSKASNFQLRFCYRSFLDSRRLRCVLKFKI